jgi:hypothetical protein
MIPDELKTKVEELEALIQTGNDYALVETHVRELFDKIPFNQGDKRVSKLQSGALASLSKSCNQWCLALKISTLPNKSSILNTMEESSRSMKNQLRIAVMTKAKNIPFAVHLLRYLLIKNKHYQC